MTHMVIFQTAQETTHHRCAGISSAIEMMERLRNEDGVESLELFELSEVEFEFRTYYHVSIANGDDVGSDSDSADEATIESLYASTDDDSETDSDTDESDEPDADDIPSNVAEFPVPETSVEDELLEPLAPLTGLTAPAEPAESAVAEVSPLPPMTASADIPTTDDSLSESAPSTPFSDAIAGHTETAVASAPQSADDIFGAVAPADDGSEDPINPFASTAELPPPPPPPEVEEAVASEPRRGLFGR